jgi:hypothetical protein
MRKPRKTKTLEKWISEAKEKHGNLFDYSKSVYTRCTNKIEIICKSHGVFKQKPFSHINGRGCDRCAKSKRVNTWSYSSWTDSGFKSKNFDSFKVYLIKCWNDSESFYKIGKTFINTSKRFGKGDCLRMPYQYKILNEHSGSARYICNLEKKLHSEFKELKYIPLKRFGGDSECFKNIETDTFNKIINYEY